MTRRQSFTLRRGRYADADWCVNIYRPILIGQLQSNIGWMGRNLMNGDDFQDEKLRHCPFCAALVGSSAQPRLKFIGSDAERWLRRTKIWT